MLPVFLQKINFSFHSLLNCTCCSRAVLQREGEGERERERVRTHGVEGGGERASVNYKVPRLRPLVLLVAAVQE